MQNENDKKKSRKMNNVMWDKPRAVSIYYIYVIGSQVVTKKSLISLLP